MFSVLRHLNYKAWFAMAEFIDNAIQSSIVNHEKLQYLHGGKFQLKVEVKIDTTLPGQITITDNAAGISSNDFPRAFRAAQAPMDRGGLSEFGMGLKSAACWFAKNWSVRTKAIDESVERKISFDIQAIVQNNIESLGTEVLEVSPEAHYTVVSLRNLHQIPQGRTIGKIRDHLASIYRIFLRDGRLELRLNNESLHYKDPEILHRVPYSSPGIKVHEEGIAPVKWHKNIDLDFGGGQSAKGFVALRAVGSTALAGFALFRRDRLIEGSFDESYRPVRLFKHANSYPYQRLFGELHLEGFEVSHTKDGFQWAEFEDIFLDLLRDEIEKDPINLIAQAENYRAKDSRGDIQVRAREATDAVIQYVEKNVEPLIVEAKQNPAVLSKLPAELAISDLQASSKTVEINDGDYCWIITLRTSVNPATEDWVSLAKIDAIGDEGRDVRRLTVDLALAHPFSAKFLGANNENIELLLRVASAVCIALLLSEDISANPPESFLFHFNSLMRGALAKTILNERL
ncbi:ATP-binding protein [Polynucleobacter sp. JS-Safj-400b-B2]|nr:ATP-binding protein [Polynucleobacter sp. JS-Safj-400b-B2]MBU3625498.1 ATP-binding protein [Polynucleobacter sp. JS-Safj-400b-B2]